MTSLLPGIVNFLLENDPVHSTRILQMFSLMERGIFPLDNICFQVFEDLIQWYSVNNVTEMRYNDDVRQSLQIGKRLFHGKFLNFMRGPCFSSQVNARETERGHFLPSNSKINFPVPNEKHLVNTSCIPNELKPGLLEDMVKKYIDNNTTAKSYNLSGDLKKIKCRYLIRNGLHRLIWVWQITLKEWNHP